MCPIQTAGGDSLKLRAYILTGMFNNGIGDKQHNVSVHVTYTRLRLLNTQNQET